MTTSFDTKADILVQFGWAYFDEPNFASLVEENSGIIDLASEHLSKSITLTNGQKKSIEDFFAHLVAMTGHEDIGFTQLEDFFLPIYDGFTENYEGWERSPLLDN